MVLHYSLFPYHFKQHYFLQFSQPDYFMKFINIPVLINMHAIAIMSGHMDTAIFFLSSVACNWLLRVNSSWHGSHYIVSVVISLSLRKPLPTIAALSGCNALSVYIALFSLTNLLDFTGFFGCIVWDKQEWCLYCC